MVILPCRSILKLSTFCSQSDISKILGLYVHIKFIRAVIGVYYRTIFKMLGEFKNNAFPTIERKIELYLAFTTLSEYIVTELK